MEMRIEASGFGVGLPGKTILVSVLNHGQIFLRDANQNETIISVRQLISANEKTGAFLAAGVSTDWIQLDPVKDNWLYNPWPLAKDHIMQIETSMGSLITTSVDISLIVFQNNREKYKSEFFNVVADGSQWASFIVRSSVSVRQASPSRRFKIYAR